MTRDVIPDYSRWQEKVNPAIAVQNDAKGFLIRAGSANLYTGEPYEDFQYARNSVECPKYADTGVYWYLRLNLNWVGQMHFLLDLIKNKPFTIRPALDVEEYKDANGNIILMNSMQSRLKTCVDIIYDELGLWPIIYTRTTIWNPFVGNPSWAANCPLWISRFAYKTLQEDVLDKCQELQPYTTTIPLPYPWQPYNWALWQCTGDENDLGVEMGVPLPPVGTLACDASLTNGTMADFMAKCGMIASPPIIPPGDDMQYCKVTLPAGQTSRNMRSLPDSLTADGDAAGLITGKVYPSDTSGDKVLPVLQIITNNEGTWYLIVKPDFTVGWVLAIAGTTHYLTLV